MDGRDPRLRGDGQRQPPPRRIRDGDLRGARQPVFVFYSAEEGAETRIETKPGDYIFVPPWVPHREENPDPENEAVVVIARTTQEAIVVNLPSLAPEQED